MVGAAELSGKVLVRLSTESSKGYELRLSWL